MGRKVDLLTESALSPYLRASQFEDDPRTYTVWNVFSQVNPTDYFFEPQVILTIST